MKHSKQQLEASISKMQAVYDAPGTSDSTKDAIRPSLEKAKQLLKQLNEAEEKPAEEKPTATAVKKIVIKANKKVKKAKKVHPAVAQAKKIAEKKSKKSRKKAPSPAMTKTQEKTLREIVAAAKKYAGYRGKSERELQLDASRKAKKPGSRVSKSGKTYREYRLNRADVDSGSPYLAKGGSLKKAEPIEFESLYDGPVQAYHSIIQDNLYFYIIPTVKTNHHQYYALKMEIKGEHATSLFDTYYPNSKVPTELAKKLAEGKIEIEFKIGGKVIAKGGKALKAITIPERKIQYTKRHKAEGGPLKEAELIENYMSMHDGMVNAYKSTTEEDIYYYVTTQGQYFYPVVVEKKGVFATEAMDDWFGDLEKATEAAKALAEGRENMTFKKGGKTGYEFGGPIEGYDLGFGSLGSGITVWDKNQKDPGMGYKTIAHISDDGEIDYYGKEKDIPAAVRQEIERYASAQESNDDEPEEEPENEINDQPDFQEDSFITDSPRTGYEVVYAGKFLGVTHEIDEAIDKLNEAEDKDQFYPNRWFISDHGNYWLIDREGNEIKTSRQTGGGLDDNDKGTRFYNLGKKYLKTMYGLDPNDIDFDMSVAEREAGKGENPVDYIESIAEKRDLDKHPDADYKSVQIFKSWYESPSIKEEGGNINYPATPSTQMTVCGYVTLNFTKEAFDSFSKAVTALNQETNKEGAYYQKAKVALKDLAISCDELLDPSMYDVAEVHYLLQRIGMLNYQTGKLVKTDFLNYNLAERNLEVGGNLNMPFDDIDDDAEAMKRGGRLLSGLKRDRKYRSNESWETAYHRRTRPVNPRYNYGKGGATNKGDSKQRRIDLTTAFFYLSAMRTKMPKHTIGFEETGRLYLELKKDPWDQNLSNILSLYLKNYAKDLPGSEKKSVIKIADKIAINSEYHKYHVSIDYRSNGSPKTKNSEENAYSPEEAILQAEFKVRKLKNFEKIDGGSAALIQKSAKGGRLKSGLMRDRAYKSNEPHELKYQRKTRPSNPRYGKLQAGGMLKDGYKGKGPREVWNSWNDDQKKHFLSDHVNIPKSAINTMSVRSFNGLESVIKDALREHVIAGQYAKGGKVYGRRSSIRSANKIAMRLG